MKFILILVFLFSILPNANAQAGRPKILIVDPDADTTDLEKSYTVEKAAPATFNLPDLNDRNKYFEGVKFPVGWDDLKKDIFFLELRTKSIDSLVKKYSDLNPSDIKKLKGKI